MEGDSDKAALRTVRICYTNHRGETRVRAVLPERIWYGVSEWHPGPGWLMDAVDLEAPKRCTRTFALRDIHWWQEAGQ
jgi:hypothetical protein